MGFSAMNDTTADSPWMLDKRVPIALILAILAQTAAGVWWAASQTARLDTAEKRVFVLESNDMKMTEAAAKSAASLAAIKASQEDMRRAIDRIERNMDARK